MATTRVTKEMIIKAAEDLEADGQKVTKMTVRDKLGAGSYGTIHPILKEWREGRDETEKLMEADVPEIISNRGAEFMALIWNEASKRAEIGHDAMQDKVTQLSSDMEEAEKESLEVITSLEGKLDAELAKANDLEAKLREVEIENGRLSSLADRTEKAEEATDVADKRIKELEAEKDQLSILNTTLRDERRELSATNMTLEHNLSYRVDEVAKLKTDLETSEEATLAVKSLAEKTAKEVHKLQVENAALKSKADALDAATKREAASAAKIEKLEASIEDVRSELKTVNADWSSARVDLAKERAEHSELKKKTELQNKK